MEKIGRKIFQPTPLTNGLVDGMCSLYGCTMNDFMNDAIVYRLTPVTGALKKESEMIFTKLGNGEEIPQRELQGVLVRAVSLLKDHPIEDVRPLEQVFTHFTNPIPRNFRYDYIQIVDSLQDERLHRLNEILKTLDDDFILGMREFGERSRYVFEHWKQVCAYSEIYIELATLIECENIYRELSVYRVLDLLMWIDATIRDSQLEPIKEKFTTNISLTQRYYGIRYEISIYHTDNGYCVLSGDNEFAHMSNEVREYYSKYMTIHDLGGDATEEDVARISALEKEGRLLFRRLSLQKTKED